MNKKGKNKKGKVPNPSPSQDEKSSDKVEDLGKSDHKIEDVGVTVGDKKEEIGKTSDIIPKVDEKVESVKDERVPEIVSEVITPPVDAKDEETPKKPKRNRGKKKKGKDDDFDDNLEETAKESDIATPVEETKVDIPETESKAEELPLITPTARKKKNKKKNAEQKSEEPVLPDQEISNIPIETTVNEAMIKESTPDIQQELKVETADQEPKPLKKKNKKKKRNDSEKSDKEEFSCTSAFQKILDDKEESEIKIKEEAKDSTIPVEIVKAETDIAPIQLEESQKLAPIQPIFEKASTPVKEEEGIKEAAAAESKGKKKNKKDKKQTPKVEDAAKLDEIKSEPIPSLIDLGAQTHDIVTEQTKEVTASSQDKPVDIEKKEKIEPVIEDSSPKPKAKIAKPVEKKRKGKHDVQHLEDTEQTISGISEPLKVQEAPSQIKLETPDTKAIVQEKTIEDLEPAKLDISDIAFMTPDEDEKLIAQEFELLAEKAMGKKRKKGSKMPKNLEIEQKVESDNKQTDVQPDVTKEQLAVITEILTPQTDQQEFVIKSEKSDIPVAVDTVKEATEKVTETLKPPDFQGKVLLTPENIGEEKEFTKAEESITQQTEDKLKTESKPGKKRKKSPKPPKKTDTETETKERPITPKPEETAKAEEVTQQSLSEKIDASNITRMYDIEISSIKAEQSEGSACDTVPDVTYPRASSQQLLDDNNNTIIREIFTPEDPILNILPTQERAPTPKKMEEKETSPKGEKTDIKSKMMEVNQDMEELRLSIERSLAELTSMEKSEETIEKEFEVTRTKAKNVSNLLFDTDKSATAQMTGVKEKTPTPTTTTVEAAASKPLDDFKPTSVVEQKIEEKSQPVAKDTKSTSDKGKHGKKRKEEKKTELSAVEMKSETSLEDASKSIESPKTQNKPTEILPTNIVLKPAVIPFGDTKLLIEEQKVTEILPPIPLPPPEEKKTETMEIKDVEVKTQEQATETPIDEPPVCPARKDNKGKHKKKKGKQETQTTPVTQSTTTTTTAPPSQTTQETKKEEKTESKSESKSDSKGQSSEKGKQQASDADTITKDDTSTDIDYEPIENFEDALTSSVDDVNKTFEIIVEESQEQNNPKINIIAPDEEKKTVSPPKNLLGHPDIPVRSNKRDFKKEKDKIPNEITARVKIKDSVEIEKKVSKNTQTINKMKEFSKDYKMDDNEDFVYKYSFRKVFLQSCCHVCKKDLSGCRVACSYCNLLFYCSNKHKDEDWPQHQALCFAVSTIVHLKDQKHIYGDAKNLTGHDYRLIRMQMIVSCEKVLKRRLVPWEQEALLYPRVCAHVPCREWRQSKLSDCQGCGQISYCTDNPDHFPKTHSRWCKSYSLYEKLVCYQQTKGRLEPKMPTKVLQEPQQIPEKINEVLASMYEEKIDINDIQYAALTQLATAPLTAAYCHQLWKNKGTSPANGVYKKSSFTIHVVGAELQFEADALNKWEVFFLHLRPDLQELRVVLINYNLNPSNLPLELLGKIKLCENCRQQNRRVVFSFQDKRTYTDYKSSEDYGVPDIVCAFNPSIQRSSVYNGKDPWPSTINAILKLKVPFIITGYTITELHKDCIRIKECSETGYNFIAEPKYNNFASVRPDRNFISDDEMPLLFKNYCYAIISG